MQVVLVLRAPRSLLHAQLLKGATGPRRLAKASHFSVPAAAVSLEGRQHSTSCIASGVQHKAAAMALTALASTAEPTAEVLTQQQVEQFHRDGFLVVPDFASCQEVADLRERAAQLLEQFNPDAISIFSTRNQSSKTDEYFMQSANNISCFFEERAFGVDGKLQQPKSLSINKMGHAMHDLDPVFRRFARSSKVIAVARALGYRRPLPVQSQYIFKQPGIGGEVAPHQDSTFLYTAPQPSVTGLWLALEDASRTNGCLWALPGVHTQGVARRFTKAPGGGVVFDKDAPTYELSAFVPLEVATGALVLLHGANVHYSAENNSDLSRHAFTLHIAEGAPGYTWAADNWLQRSSELPFQPLYQ